MIIVFMRIV